MAPIMSLPKSTNAELMKHRCQHQVDLLTEGFSKPLLAMNAGANSYEENF
ncbi:hypothetical protein [Shewanella sp. GD04112]|nr:hypothetical protein [Shewanella sp. GD04112]MDH0450895.1 hypothetical protein [Shewanella sp. GD04112]